MRILLSLLLTSFCLGCATTTHLDDLRQLNAHQQQLDSIWPGYQPLARGLGYIDDEGKIYLAGNDMAVHNLKASEKGIWLAPQGSTDLTAMYYIDHQITPELTATIVQADAPPFLRKGLLLHEDFHGYQRDSFQGDMASTLSFADVGDADLLELFAILSYERNLLVNALMSVDTNPLPFISSYVALRSWRESQLPSSVSETEHSIERKEGSAFWVEAQARGILTQSNSEGVLIQRLLSGRFGIVNDVSSRIYSHRLYGTGGAVLALVELFIERDVWQQAISGGATPFTLLAQQIPLTQQEKDDLVAEALGSLHYNRELRQLRKMKLPDPPHEVAERTIEAFPYFYDLYFPLQSAESDNEFQVNYRFSQLTTFPDGVLLPEILQLDVNTETHHLSLQRVPVFIYPEQPEVIGEKAYGRIGIFTNNTELTLGEHQVSLAELGWSGEEAETEAVPIKVQVRPTTEVFDYFERNDSN